MPEYFENLIQFCLHVLEHYELEDETPRMFCLIKMTFLRHNTLYDGIMPLIPEDYGSG